MQNRLVEQVAWLPSSRLTETPYYGIDALVNILDVAIREPFLDGEIRAQLRRVVVAFYERSVL